MKTSLNLLIVCCLVGLAYQQNEFNVSAVLHVRVGTEECMTIKNLHQYEEDFLIFTGDLPMKKSNEGRRSKCMWVIVAYPGEQFTMECQKPSRVKGRDSQLVRLWIAKNRESLGGIYEAPLKISDVERLYIAREFHDVNATQFWCTCYTSPISNQGQRRKRVEKEPKYATYHEFPSLVAIWDLKEDRPYCAGTIIGDRYVLTAASCYNNAKYPQEYGVMTGVHNLEQENRYQYLLKVLNIIPHFDFNKTAREDNDIALVITEKPMIFSECIKPACLPLDYSKELLEPEKVAVTAGWGMKNVGEPPAVTNLQKGDMDILEDDICQYYFEQFDEIFDLCSAPAISRKEGTCWEDIGGPLYIIKNDKHLLLGLHSAIGCGNYPNRDTYIQKYIPWLKRYIFPGTELCS